VKICRLPWGEAAANVVEHAYATTSEPGEFTYQLTRRGDGGIDVEVRDFGRWRPEPSGNRHRGRGLVIIREIATDVVVEPSPAGTQVRFRLPPPPPDPPPAIRPPTRQAQPDATPPAPAELHVHPQPDGGRRLELRGELDLTTATTLREPLLDQLSAPGPVTLDLRGLDYLSSAGVGLLIDATQHAATHHTPLQLQLTPHSLVARLLALTGVEHILPVATDATEQPDAVLVRALLTDAAAPVDLAWAQSLSEAQRLWSAEMDCVPLDLHLPDARGLGGAAPAAAAGSGHDGGVDRAGRPIRVTSTSVTSRRVRATRRTSSRQFLLGKTAAAGTPRPAAGPAVLLASAVSTRWRRQLPKSGLTAFT
jgi:anti-anti-sigma factor